MHEVLGGILTKYFQMKEDVKELPNGVPEEIMVHWLQNLKNVNNSVIADSVSKIREKFFFNVEGRVRKRDWKDDAELEEYFVTSAILRRQKEQEGE